MVMSELRSAPLAWVFVALTAAAAAGLLSGVPPVGASDDHEEARELRTRGEVVPLATVLDRPDLAGTRVLEAELEREHGRLVYELEILDSDGRVSKRYFDAATGEALDGKRGD
jgi:hypothetical protein